MSTSPQHDDISWPRELLGPGEAFQKRVQNPTMFRVYMLAKQTTLGVTGAYLDVIEVTHARMILPEAFTTRDLFGRVATAAIVSAAEMCSASILMLNLRNQESRHRPRLVDLHVETLHESEAIDTMSFETEEGTAYGEFVARTDHDRLDSAKASFVVLGRDAVGELTHRITLTWELSKTAQAHLNTQN